MALFNNRRILKQCWLVYNDRVNRSRYISRMQSYIFTSTVWKRLINAHFCTEIAAEKISKIYLIKSRFKHFILSKLSSFQEKICKTKLSFTDIFQGFTKILITNFISEHLQATASFLISTEFPKEIHILTFLLNFWQMPSIIQQ